MLNFLPLWTNSDTNVASNIRKGDFTILQTPHSISAAAPIDSVVLLLKHFPSPLSPSSSVFPILWCRPFQLTMISSQKLAQLQGILLEKQSIVQKNEERINLLIEEIARIRFGLGATVVESSSEEEEDEIIEVEESEEDDVPEDFGKHPRKVGEFSIRDTSTVIDVNTAKAFLRREVFKCAPGPQPGLPIDLLKDVDNFFCTELKNERFPTFLKWIQQAAPQGKALKEFLLGAEFVSLRGTLIRLPKGRPVVCCKFQGVIFLCETKWDNRESNKHSIYQHLMLRDYVSEKCLAKEPTDKSDEFYMVYSCGEATESSARFAYATKIDCVDENGDPVQVTPFGGRPIRPVPYNETPTVLYLEQRKAVVRATCHRSELTQVKLLSVTSSPDSDEKAASELARLQQALVAIRQRLREAPEGTYFSVHMDKNAPSVKTTHESFIPASFQRRFKQ
uniref:Decapping nuclease n=1 Tax=Steinernema glaseri TaxID=37863 RepID=A0A1I7YP33_9BILA